MSPWRPEHPLQYLLRFSAEAFVREVGLWPEQFQALVKQVTAHLEEERQQQPMKKRGRKPTLRVDTQLLLTVSIYGIIPRVITEGKNMASANRMRARSITACSMCW